MPSPAGRYQMLDALRAVAAMAVVVFHCGNAIVGPETAAGRALLAGWTGVFLFFPISGYCILGALHAGENSTLRAFLVRRWRRIVPPYWASVALAVGIALAALPFNAGSFDDTALTPAAWLSMLTLTQVFTIHVGAINPVYWSLCYEEQFYLVMGLLLLVPAHRRAAVVALLTAAAAVYLSPFWSWRVRGIFLDYWMCFSAGCAAYLWLHAPTQRLWAAAIAGIAAGSAFASGDVALSISLGTAILLVVLAPVDARLAATKVGAILIAVGTFSYSLYLVHVPVGGRLTNLLDRFDLPPYAIVALSSAVSVAAAWLFYLAVEKPARPPRRSTVRTVYAPSERTQLGALGV